MGYAENRGDYWRGRYKQGPGRYGTVRDAAGVTVRFRTRREAEQAANDAEAKVRAGTWRDPIAGRITFGEYANRWYAAQDLAASTMQNYRHHIEEHLLPFFEEMAVADILPSDVGAWEKRQRAAGYAESSVRGRRKTLHLMLADAVDEGLRESNPATRRRGRGRRGGHSWKRAPEKAITTPLGVLLIAERAALLSGRDDEFVTVVLMGYTGMRWGEVVGLEVPYVRPAGVRVEWQLYELDTGELLRCPPKDESRRTIDAPAWLAGLLSDHLVRVQPKPCACHEMAYVFRSHGSANGAARQSGPRVVDVARRAGVSTGTVSSVLNRPAAVSEATRAKVELVMRELGYVPRGGSGELSQRGRSCRRVLAAGRLGPDSARAAAHPQDVHGGAGYAGQAYGRADGSRGRVSSGAVLTHHGGDAPAAPRRADRAVGGGIGRTSGAIAGLASGDAGSAAAAAGGQEREMSRQDRLPVLSQEPPEDGPRATFPYQEIGPELRFRWSGRRDLNPRPLDPQSSALPSCATSRCPTAGTA